MKEQTRSVLSQHTPGRRKVVGHAEPCSATRGVVEIVFARTKYSTCSLRESPDDSSEDDGSEEVVIGVVAR